MVRVLPGKGASSGIGAETAVKFAANGAKVSITGRNQDRLDITVAKCRAAGASDDSILSVTGDVRLESDTRKIVTATVEKFGKLDVLVNNAGTSLIGYVREVSESDVLDQFQTNTVSMFNLIKNSLPHLLKTKGNVVNVSSVASTIPCPQIFSYGMAKAAVNHLTKSLALQYACKGVRFNIVSPGFTDTPVFINMGLCEDQAAYQKFVEHEVQQLPMQRIGQPSEVADNILFLASDMASFVTGAEYVVDGGKRLWNQGSLDINGVKNLD